MPDDRDDNIAFCNCLQFFRVIHTRDSETYARMHLRKSDALARQYSPFPAGLPVHAATAAHVWAVLVQDDQEHDTRNVEGILAAGAAAVQPKAKA